MDRNLWPLWTAEGGSASPLGRLGIDGQFFTLDEQPFTLIQSSDFSLFKRSLDGEDITPILEQRQAVGFNALRVWLLNASVVPGTIHPDQYSDFYERLSDFVDVCGLYGFVVELTVFTQTKTLMPSREDQQRHLDRTADAVRGKGNVLLEQVNEWDQHDNAPYADLHRPPGVLISRGSNGADSIPPMHHDPWDYEVYHTNDLAEFQRKVGHNAFEWATESGKPCVSNENTRYPDRDSSEAHAYDAAMGGALLCAGSCYHSESGKWSVLFAYGPETDCARAWVDGANSVPLAYQRGFYTHRTELEGPDCLRACSRTLPDGREHVILIRP